jgi:ATP-dependent Lhr-like helicase
VDEEFLIDDGGLVSIGPRAEKEFGGRFFRDLTSAFTSEPAFTATWGREVLGELPALALAARPVAGPTVVLLGGRSWTVRHVDWRARRVQVELSDSKGSTRWTSGGRAKSHVLARAHHDVLAGQDPVVGVSRRARAGLAELRAKYNFVEQSGGFHTYLVRQEPAAPTWWTFAGFAANSALASGFADLLEPGVSDLFVQARSETSRDDLRTALRDRRDQLALANPRIDEEAVDGLKFSAAIPRKLADQTVRARLADREAVLSTVDASLRVAVIPPGLGSAAGSI